MDKKSLYLEAYRMFDNIHPLKFDCGRLCDQLCCRGTDDEFGMYLFPGEEVLHDATDWMTIGEANFVINQQPVLIASCKGECNRTWRPLACRIFPLTPVITPKEILIVKEDPRARNLCPLTKETNRFPIRREFKTAVRRGFALLIQDPEIRNFVKEFSIILSELECFEWNK